jgi:hypothetical protein
MTPASSEVLVGVGVRVASPGRTVAVIVSVREGVRENRSAGKVAAVGVSAKVEVGVGKSVGNTTNGSVPR